MADLWLRIVQTSGARLYSQLVGLLILFLTARLLGPEGRGLLATLSTWANLFAVLGGCSLGQVVLHRLAEGGQARLASLLGSLLLLTALFSVCGWLVALALHLSPNGPLHALPALALLVALLGVPLLIWEQYGSALLMGLERLHVYNRAQVVGRSLALLCMLLLVPGMEWGLLGVLLAVLTGQVTVAVRCLRALLAEVGRQAGRLRVHWAELRALLRDAAVLHLNAVGWFVISSVDVLLISHYRSASETGHYQLAAQLIGSMQLVPQAVTMVVYGRLVSAGADAAWPLQRRLLWQVTAGMLVLAFVAGTTAPWWLVWMAGEPFRPAVEVFCWMLPGVVGMTWSAVMAPQWIGRGLFGLVAGLSVGTATLSLLVNLYLIPRFGMWGAAATFVGIMLLSMVSNGVMIWFCSKRQREVSQ